MRKISVFNFMSVNGFVKDLNGDTSWHTHSVEGNAYSEKKLSVDHILLFGRKTYEMMYGFWPTDMAHDLFPVVAKKMTSSEKIVVSNTIKKAQWKNTSIMSGDVMQQLKTLKKQKGKDIAILGSISLVVQMVEEGLVDEIELMLDPIVLGEGTSFLGNLSSPLNLRLLENETFSDGTVVLKYKVLR